MTWTKDNMFEPSGCLTREAFEALVNGTLSAGAIVSADEHIASCPFCSDALEGFQSHSKRSFPEIMNKADASFDNIMSKNHNKSSGMRMFWLSVSAAASILLIAGLLYLINLPNPKMQVAESIPTADTIATETAKQPAKIEDAKVYKEKQPTSSPKEERPKSVHNSVRFSPPGLASEEVTSTPTQIDDLKEKSNAATVVAESESETVSNARRTTSTATESKKSDEMIADKEMAKREYKSYSSVASTKAVSGKGEEAQPQASVEQMPEYPGGPSAMTTFISQNLQYPKDANELGITGRVFVGFIVEEDGTLSNIKILRGIGGGCDEEAIRVVRLMPKWIPGRQDGRNVKTRYTLPIKFDLQSK